MAARAPRRYRTARRLAAEGGWESLAFEDLQPGDRFRLYERGWPIYEGIVRSHPEPCQPEGNFTFEADQLVRLGRRSGNHSQFGEAFSGGGKS